MDEIPNRTNVIVYLRTNSTRFFWLIETPVAARCSWTVQCSWWVQFLYPLPSAVYSATLPRRLPKNHCIWRRIDDTPQASTATGLVLIRQCERQYDSRQSHGCLHQSLTTPTVGCLYHLQTTIIHPSLVRRRFGFGCTCTSRSTCLYFWLTYCCNHRGEICKARAMPEARQFL